MRPIIVIPIYSERLTSDEKASLKQCLSILGKYDIAFLTYSDLDTTVYEQHVSLFKTINVRYEYFDKKNFKDIEGYNRFCLSSELYERFTGYDYMLIYQLDAWVFEDRLMEWCEKGYDYIGPPFFDDWSSDTPCIIGVGNGGLSLRRIQFFNDLLKLGQRMFSAHQLFRQCSCFADYLRFVPKAIFGIKNTTNDFIQKKYEQGFNEDVIISVFLKDSLCVPNIPSPEVAMNFAMERYPSKLYHATGNQLPFGCHAFRKYEFDTFWSQFIKLN